MATKLTSVDKKQVIATTFTIANTMMGVAVLSLPFTFSRLGWILSIVLVALAGMYSVMGYYKTIENVHYSQIPTLRGLLTSLFGRVWANIFDFCIAFEQTGFLVCYISVIGDYLNVFIKNVADKDFNTKYIKLICMPILALLSMLSSAKALSNVSAFAILCILMTVLSVAVYYFIGVSKNEQMDGSPLPAPGKLIGPAHKNGTYIFLEIVQRIPLFMPLYGGLASAPPLYVDLENSRYKAMIVLKKASFYGALITAIICTVNAICAYFLFGRDIASNVLLSFPSSELWMSICRLLFAIVVLSSYVVIVYPVRRIYMDWFKQDYKTKKGKVVFIIIGYVLVVATTVISMFVPDIVFVLNIVSSIFGVGIKWVIPLLMWWKAPQIKANSPIRDDIDVDNAPSPNRRKQSIIATYLRQSITYGTHLDWDWHTVTLKQRAQSTSVTLDKTAIHAD